MSEHRETKEVNFVAGYRYKAIEAAIDLVKEAGVAAELVICRDLPGPHEGGEDCFCQPDTILIDPKELE